jgi:hypothetical protein
MATLTFYIDDVMLSQGSVVPTYADGDSAGWHWMGTPGASVSLQGTISSPINTVAPTITGNAIEGSVLSCSTGTWTGNPPITYTYLWTGAGTPKNTSSYTTVAGDLHNDITCTITATNSYGNNSQVSNSYGPITAGGSAPVNTAAPVASGSTIEGSVLSTTNGTWSNTPTSYQYAWDGAGSPVNESTYTTVAGDVGNDILCVVTATNTFGSVNADSNNVGPITSSGGGGGGGGNSPNNQGSLQAALAPNLWTFQPTLGDEFNTVYANSGGTGLNPAVWANGWFASTQFGASGPFSSNFSPGSWCDPAQVLVTTTPGNNAASSYGAIAGFTGNACLQLTIETKSGDGGTIAQGFCVTNPHAGSYGGGYSGLTLSGPCYLECRVWLMPYSSGVVANYPTVWLGSQSDPATGEIDIFEPLGTNGAPLGHYHGPTDDGVDPSGQLNNAAGVWSTIGVLVWPAAPQAEFSGYTNLGNGPGQCYWFGAANGENISYMVGLYSNNMNGTNGPFYWILNNGEPQIMGSNTNVYFPAIMLVDYVRCWTPASGATSTISTALQNLPAPADDGNAWPM